MSGWLENIDNHSVWESITLFSEPLDAAKERAGETDPYQLELVERIADIHGIVLRHLQAANRLHLSPHYLSNVQTQIQKIQGSLKQFTSLHQQRFLESANEASTHLLGSIAAVPLTTTSTDVEAFGDSVTNFRRHAAKLSQDLKTEVDAAISRTTHLAGELDKLKSAIDRDRERLDKFISQSQSQVTTAETQRATKFQSRLDADSERFSAKFSELEKKSGVLLDKLRHRFEEQVLGEAHKERKEHEKLFQASMLKWNTDTSDMLEKFSNSLHEYDRAGVQQRIDHGSKSEQLITDITKHRKKAEDLVGTIAATGHAAGYQKVANQEQNAARRFQALALFAFFCFTAFALYAFFNPSSAGSAEFSWGETARRILVSASLLLIASFAAKEATKHQERERRNRRHQLRLASLDPFLQSLSEEKRDELKESLVQDFFGADNEPASPPAASAGPILRPDVQKLVELIVRALSGK